MARSQKKQEPAGGSQHLTASISSELASQRCAPAAKLQYVLLREPRQQLCSEGKAGADSSEGPVPHQVQKPPAAPSHTPHRDWKVIRQLQTTDLPSHLHSIGFSGPWVFPFLLWAGTEKDEAWSGFILFYFFQHQAIATIYCCFYCYHCSLQRLNSLGETREPLGS